MGYYFFNPIPSQGSPPMVIICPYASSSWLFISYTNNIAPISKRVGKFMNPHPHGSPSQEGVSISIITTEISLVTISKK